MGWDRRGYFYSARKINGRVVRSYVGSGKVAELAAELDVIERESRVIKKAEVKIELDRVAALDESVDEFDSLVEQLALAALDAAGFHRHHRGEWRKRRERPDEIGQ